MFVYQPDPYDPYEQTHGFSLRGLDFDTYRLARAWARKQFGRASAPGRWYHGGATIWIRDEPDALTFRLRWC